MQVAGTIGAAADRDANRVAGGLLFVVAFLAAEPPLRTLLWWADPRLSHTFHADPIWLVLGALALLVSPLIAPVRATVAARSWLVAVGLVWVAFAVISSAQASLPSPAFVRCAKWLLFLAFGLWMVVALRRRAELATPILLAWAAGFIVQALVVAAFAWTHSGTVEIDWTRELPGVFNVRHLGFEAMAAALIGSLFRPSGPGWTRALLRLAAVAGWAVVLWTGGRGSFLAACAAIAAAAFLAPRAGRLRLLAELPLLFGTGFLIATLHAPPDGSFGLWRALGFTTVAAGTGVEQFSSGRTAIWRESLAFIAAHPLTGIGDGQMKLRLVSAQGYFAQPHNLLLQAWLSWGVVGGTAFLIAIAAVLQRIVARILGVADLASPAMAGVAVVLALGANAFIDGTLYHHRPTMLFLIACAVALAARRGRC